MSQIKAKVEGFPLDKALAELVKQKAAKFDETVELILMLGVDPKQSDQQIRLATTLPHGLGKQVKVAVFAEGDLAQAAKDAGADRVGMDDLMASMKKGELDYQVVIASKSSIAKIAVLGKVLGPKGLMPNPKLGTVTDDVAHAVQQAKSGQARV